MREQDKVFYTAEYYRKDFWNDLREIFYKTHDPEKPIKRRLLIVFIFFGALPVIFALVMFCHAYNKLFLSSKRVYPYLHHHRRPVYAGMIFGAGLTILIIFFPLIKFLGLTQSHGRGSENILPVYFFVNLIVVYVAIRIFKGWQSRLISYVGEMARHGSAEFADSEALAPYYPKLSPKGFYLGGGLAYNKPGHLLTVAGTRGGKGVNLIIPNLTKLGTFEGSWVVIDPKGENAAITARIQREMGKKVVVLNPWGLHGLENSSFNPIDIIGDDTNNLNFVDDIQLIAEMIIPIDLKNSDDKFFKDRARSIFVGLLIHLIVSESKENRTFKTLWEWLRKPENEWKDLLADMAVSDNDIVRGVANEIKTMSGSEKTYVSIISTVLDETDFLKSPALQKSLAKSDFQPDDLTNGNTVVYVIIPADKLKTHAKWLRLVVTSTLRAVIRKPNKEVCFLLDEFYALGYISEIEVALGAYAGYGVHIWAILQNLIQLKDMYGDNWETFISSCSVRNFFNIADNFTADYVSHMFGHATIPKYNNLGMLDGSTQRFLVNPDELRRTSGKVIFSVIDDLAPAIVYKQPYYEILKEGVDYDRNPYIK